jgi:hydroxymethylpyrimidine pyrophosphatase-like HAD family hydrolase
MVVLDIDGTLHAASDTDRRAQDAISVAVRAAVRAVARSGTPVVLCTGRLSPSTMPFLWELDICAGFSLFQRCSAHRRRDRASSRAGRIQTG